MVQIQGTGTASAVWKTKAEENEVLDGWIFVQYIFLFFLSISNTHYLARKRVIAIASLSPDGNTRIVSNERWSAARNEALLGCPCAWEWRVVVIVSHNASR